jgi:nodulation protein F
MSICTSVQWDGRFETLLRRHLPFLGANDQLSTDASLRDLGLDSMGVVELLADLESGYAVRFRDEALTMATFATPGVLWGVLSAMSHAAV